MKNIILLICCLLAKQYSFGQSASLFYKKADSLYKIKDYKNSAIADATGIRMEGINAPVGRHYSSACSWSLAGIPDSAFYHLGIIARSGKLTVSLAKEIENDSDFDPIKNHTRWPLIITSILDKAISNIQLLSEAIRSGKRIYPTLDKYEIALAWATVKNADSVLYYLSSIINTDYNRYSDHATLSKEKTFSFLHDDPRWIPLVNEVKKNTPVFVCEHRPRELRIPMKVTFDAASEFLKDDGKGSYLQNEDKVSSNIFTAYNLLLSGIEPLQQSGNWSDASPRYFSINLNNPVKNSGSVKQGIIVDHFATFHAFFKIDTTAKLDLIYNFNEISPGTTIESPRTDIHFFLKGKLHMLKFGYWGSGDCGEPYTCGGKVNGSGTTMVKITRHTATSYTIEAPKGSIGRLWDIDNRTKPVNKGLFHSGFILHVENL
ncbi:MAG TPA: hypothetical protein VMZ03_03100 [Chitinophagaceae bacterium]|nr:hypothetical protein [Chitinophagaceae bacterium]